MALDGYGGYERFTDTTGSLLTYINSTTALPYGHLGLDANGRWKTYDNNEIVNVVCVKDKVKNEPLGYELIFEPYLQCTKERIDFDYECHDTDFGTVVNKKFTEKLGRDAAEQKCKKDADFLHFPKPRSEAENAVYSWHAFESITRYNKPDLTVESFWIDVSDEKEKGKFGCLKLFEPFSAFSKA